MEFTSQNSVGQNAHGGRLVSIEGPLPGSRMDSVAGSSQCVEKELSFPQPFPRMFIGFFLPRLLAFLQSRPANTVAAKIRFQPGNASRSHSGCRDKGTGLHLGTIG